MKILNTTRKTLVANNAEIADTFFFRMMGLLNRKSLKPQEALIITQCQSIHMLFMKFPIDVIFISSHFTTSPASLPTDEDKTSKRGFEMASNRSHQVVGLVKGIKPFCFSPLFFKANAAIELPVNVIETSQTQLGDSLHILSN